MLVPITFSDLERRDAKGQIFLALSVITLVPFDVERTNSAVYYEREGVFVGAQPLHRVCTSASRGLSAIAEFLCMSRLPHHH